MKWEKKYSVGIEEIDSQHKRLFEMVNEFYSTSRLGEPKEAISRILAELSEYVIIHFNFEEKYFDQFRYKYTDEHRQEHQDLKDKITELIERADNGIPIMTMEVSNFMRDWLQNHTYTSDQRYRECFKKNWPTRTKQSI